MDENTDEIINNCWLDTNSRTHIWEIIYKHEIENIINSDNEVKVKNTIKTRLLKVYELVVIFSSLACAALVGISNSNNENHTIVIIHDTVRGYGIVISSLGAIVSLSSCMIMSALPQQHIMEFLHIFMKYSNIPVLTTLFSIFAMMICASLQFKEPVIWFVLPNSVISFCYSLYVYNQLRSKLIMLID